MSYEALMIYCNIMSVLLSGVLGAVLTVGIYKLTKKAKVTNKRARISVIAEVCKPSRTPEQDKLFTDLLCGKFEIK